MNSSGTTRAALCGLLTAILCLDDMTAQNGATVVLPGTHRIPHEQVKASDTDIPEVDLPDGPRITVTCPAGSAALSPPPASVPPAPSSSRRSQEAAPCPSRRPPGRARTAWTRSRSRAARSAGGRIRSRSGTRCRPGP